MGNEINSLADVFILWIIYLQIGERLDNLMYTYYLYAPFAVRVFFDFIMYVCKSRGLFFYRNSL